MQNKFNSRGQITIFIILAIVIVIGIIAYFYLYQAPTVAPTPEYAATYIEQCTKDVITAGLDKVLAGGGAVNPELYTVYGGVSYHELCYQYNYYDPCVNQHPMLMEYAQSELKNNTEGKIAECFSNYISELEDQGYDVQEGNLNYSIKIVSDKVLVSIKKKLDVKKESSASFDDFSFEISSPIYGLIEMARRVINSEAEICSFDERNVLTLYPQYSIDPPQTSGEKSKLYIVEHRNSGKQFKFAVRGCVVPPQI